ncbi:hypothetical protein LCGC14_3015740 [marine sediment metagenome]|uniref:Uncharacterized protein n=1 Tax=marine sediment metagenome TaxID=412755 RepID=A0A0F8ZMY3_9ZZZZ
MTLIIEQRFKLLNTLCLLFQNQRVFMRGQGNQVYGSVITPNSIKMMNVPTFRQEFVVRLLPYIDMLINIWTTLSSWMFRHIDANVILALLNMSTTRPPTTVSSNIYSAHTCPHTLPTSFSRVVHGLPAIWASAFHSGVACFLSSHIIPPLLYCTIYSRNTSSWTFLYNDSGTRFDNIQPYEVE